MHAIHGNRVKARDNRHVWSAEGKKNIPFCKVWARGVIYIRERATKEKISLEELKEELNHAFWPLKWTGAIMETAKYIC
jgi:hypothetical protein